MVGIFGPRVERLSTLTKADVEQSNFPDIVDESYVTDTNLDGGEGFDSTPAVFDATVVNEYLNGTGQMGGPLVTAPNVTDRSDYRLYISDANATMQSMREEAAFRSKCFSVFERMINTVPSTVVSEPILSKSSSSRCYHRNVTKGVILGEFLTRKSQTLSDVVTPMTWKAVDVVMDIDTAGTVSVSGLIRNLYTSIAPPDTVSYTTYSTSAGNSSVQTSDAVSGTGTSLYGNTTYWSFNTSTASPSTTSLNFEDVSYPINDNIFILPAQSLVNKTSKAVTVRAAALTSLASSDSMTATMYVPTSVQGTLNKQIQNVTVPMTAYGTAGNYTLYEGSETLTSVARSVIAKVALGDAASRTLKIKVFNGF